MDLDPVADADEAELRELLERHAMHTGSTVAQSLLENWPHAAKSFVKVMPRDYKRALCAAADAVAAASPAADSYAQVAHG